MRLGTLLAILAILSLSVGSALAEKEVELKEWHYPFGLAREVLAEVEPNDDFTTAMPILCGDQVDPAGLADADVDYYSFAGVAGALFTAGTDAGLDPAAGDTKMYLYDGAYNEIAYDDDGGPGFYSLISMELPADDTYYILVIPYGASNVGSYILSTECGTAQEPPENDTCDGAIPIENCTSGVIEGDLTWANNDYDPGSGGCTGYSAAGNDVVYVVDLEAGNLVNLFLFGGWDESLYIVTDCADPVGSCVAGADATVGAGETIAWEVTMDGTYYIICDAYGTGNGTTFTLDYDLQCPVPPTGACCFDLDCVILTEAACVADQGVYKGDDVPCDPNPCEEVATEATSWGQIKSQYK